MPTNFDLWNGVAFAPSASISELADSLTPAVQGALSDMRSGAESVLSLAGKVPNNIPDAAELAGMADSLRDKFKGMMAGQVQALCVHPWQQGIGERAGDYAWLTRKRRWRLWGNGVRHHPGCLMEMPPLCSCFRARIWPRFPNPSVPFLRSSPFRMSNRQHGGRSRL